MARPSKSQREKAKLEHRRRTYIGLRQLARRHAVQLSEHFSSVQIITTFLEPDGNTMYITEGSGDMMARIKGTEVWCRMANEVHLGQ